MLVQWVSVTHQVATDSKEYVQAGDDSQGYCKQPAVQRGAEVREWCFVC